MALTSIINDLFRSDRPAARVLTRELTMVAIPGESFRVGRKGEPVSIHEIDEIEAQVREAGFALGSRRQYDTAKGMNVVEWSLAGLATQEPLFGLPGTVVPPVNPCKFE